MMTFNGVKNTVRATMQNTGSKEESKRGRRNRTACMTPPGMLLSDSLEHNYCKHWSKHRNVFYMYIFMGPFLQHVTDVKNQR
jgi:hypothetical protein